MSTLLLETQGLGVSFGGVHAVREVDFRLERGEVRCLIGPNGAGKSTFFKMLSGQLQPSRGEIRFKGRPLRGLATHEVARLGIGIKTQVPSVFEGLDLRENLRLAAARRAQGVADEITAEVLAEIGLVGKAPGRYNLHIGGNRSGTRIPRMYRENITEPEILSAIDELVARWANEREEGEGFGDFTIRAGIIRPVLDPARDFWE